MNRHRFLIYFNMFVRKLSLSKLMFTIGSGLQNDRFFLFRICVYQRELNAVGTTAGLYRLDGVGNIFTYNRNNAHFESNNITAIGVLPGDGNYSGVWVACDAFVKFSENGPGLDGSDMLPDLVPRGNGTFAVIDKILPSDIRYHSTSLHYFDGRTWEKWRIAGVRDLLTDRDYFWAATNVRVRRIRIVH